MICIRNDIYMGISKMSENNTGRNIGDSKYDWILEKVQFLSIYTFLRSTKRNRKISKRKKNYYLKSNYLNWEERNKNADNFKDLLEKCYAEKIQCLENSNLPAIKLLLTKWNINTDPIHLFILHEIGSLKPARENLENFSSNKFSSSLIIVCVPRLSFQLNTRISIVPLLLAMAIEKIGKDFIRLNKRIQRNRNRNKQLLERAQNNSIDQAKRKADVKEIVSIKNKYEHVIYGKPIKNLTGKFTTSHYIKPNCDFNKCPCHEQERLLNESLRNLPSNSSECDIDFVSEEFTEQILAWASSIYECAPSLRSSCKMLATSDFLFIFGGSNPNISEKALQDVYRFNLLTRRWKKLKVDNLPTSLISYAICWNPNTDDENLVGYLFGGSEDPDGNVMSHKLYRFTIDTEGYIKFQKLKVEIFQNRKISQEVSKNCCDQENKVDSKGKIQEQDQNFEQSKIIKTEENSIQQNFKLQELINDNKSNEKSTSYTLITPEVHKTKKAKSLKGAERDPRKPSPRCGSPMAMNSDGKLYIVGGVDKKSYLLDVWVVDTNANKLMWRPIIKSANNLKGRYTHEIVIVEEKILLLGGGDENWSAAFDKIDVFDIKTQQFIQIETLPDGDNGYPKPRKFHSVVKNGNDIYIVGGWLDNEINEQDRSTNDEEEVTIFEDIWILSIIKINDETFYRWTKCVSSLKMPLFFHTSAITPEGCIYTFGGCIDAKSMYPSNKLQRVWVQPPELKQISMFKELMNNPKLVEIFKQREIEQEILKREKDKSTESTQRELNKQVNMEEIENSLKELRQTKPMRLIRLILEVKLRTIEN